METFEQVWPARGSWRQELQGDGLIQREIRRAIDFAHPAAPDQADHTVAVAEQRPRRKVAVLGRPARR